ncbi:hypothetical protein X975_21874, partial [Stegodyphus mimosarum]
KPYTVTLLLVSCFATHESLQYFCVTSNAVYKQGWLEVRAATEQRIYKYQFIYFHIISIFYLTVLIFFSC